MEGQMLVKLHQRAHTVSVSIFYLDENCVCSFVFLPCHKINKTMTYVSQLAVILCAFESCSMCPAAVIFFPIWKDGGGTVFMLPATVALQCHVYAMLTLPPTSQPTKGCKS